MAALRTESDWVDKRERQTEAETKACALLEDEATVASLRSNRATWKRGWRRALTEGSVQPPKQVASALAGGPHTIPPVTSRSPVQECSAISGPPLSEPWASWMTEKSAKLRLPLQLASSSSPVSWEREGLSLGDSVFRPGQQRSQWSNWSELRDTAVQEGPSPLLMGSTHHTAKSQLPAEKICLPKSVLSKNFNCSLKKKKKC